jgi:hypothetical protein
MTRQEGLAHLDRLAIRGAITTGPIGLLPPRKRFAAPRWLGTAALYCSGFAGIGLGAFAVWGLVQ